MTREAKAENADTRLLPLAVACGCALAAAWPRLAAEWTAGTWRLAVGPLGAMSLIALCFPIVGAWQDRLGRRLLTATVTAAAALVIFCLDRLFGFAAPLWLVGGVGAGLLLATTFLAVASSVGETRDQALASPAFAALGAPAAAALAAAALASIDLTADWLFWLLALFAAGLLALVAVTADPEPHRAGDPASGAALGRFFGRLEQSDWLAVSLYFLAGFAAALAWRRFAAFADPPPGWSAWPSAPAFALAAAAMGAVAARSWLATFSLQRTLTLSLLSVTVAALALGLATRLWEVWLLAGLAAFSAGAGLPAGLSLGVRIGRQPHAATFMGLLAAAAVWGGAIAAMWGPGPGPASAWLLAFAGGAAALLVHVPRLDSPVDPFAPETDAPNRLVWRNASLPGLARHTFFSRLTQLAARALVEVFFGRLRVHGHDRLVQKGGAILVANHPNTFLDPLLITALAPGRLHYWAKATLWRSTIIGSILDRLGAMPVQRRQDAPTGATFDNRRVFGAAAEKLNRGAHALIFPEGVSQTGLSLKPVKTGAARLGFQALAQNDWSDDLPLIPIGLDYAEPSLFRSPVTVRVGEPLWLRGYKDDYQTDPRRTAAAVTDALSERLKSLLPHLDRPELEELTQHIHALYGEQVLTILDKDDQTEARRAIAQAVNHYQRLDPDTLWLFKQRVDAYFAERERLSTPENHPPIPARRLLRILAGFFSFQSFGLIANWLPYRLTGRLAAWLDPPAVWLATAKLGFGALIFGLYYALIVAVCHFFFGPLAAGLALAALVLSGMAALGSLDRVAFRIQQLGALWQAFWTQDTNDNLEAMKLSLIHDLERFRETYAFYRSQEES